jgi:predicted nucleotidyltransferase
LVLGIAAERIKQSFGDQILACYVIGSHADGTAVSKSDMDLVVIFKGQGEDDDKQSLQALCKTLTGELSIPIDLEMLDERKLKSTTDPVLKLGSHLLFGSDIRETLSLLEIEAWARDRLHTSYWRTTALFNRPSKVTLPLDYPSSEDPFFGYVVSGSTRTLVRHISWAATALIAHQARTYVVRKADFPGIYRKVINDEFSDYLEQLYEQCKVEWDYQIPDNSADLADLCRQTLAFENHFMDVYKFFLLSELQSGARTAHLAAIKVLNVLPLLDAEVKAAMNQLAQDSSAEVGNAARTALAAIDRY